MEKIFTAPIYELGPEFYDEVEGAGFPQSQLRYRNQNAASLIGLASLPEEQWESHFFAFKPLPGNIQKPLALRYHGHQFGSYNPELGDGRGFLFAQFQTPERLYDLGTKGSGQTPYSRQGDGRLTLKGAFREALCTEMLESLGVDTSKTFSFFETGESLERQDEPSPTRAAVLFRLSHGHIRIGTFQRLGHFGQHENIQKLVNYCLKYYYPELPQSPDPTQQVKTFLQEVVKKTSHLVASYMTAGFVHGVLNTDNINISGESFDYGPYRFLPDYDPTFTAAYFDQRGFYCFGRQPGSVLWSLEQLVVALSPTYPEVDFEPILVSFSENFNDELLRRFQNRLNLAPQPETAEILALFFQFLEKKTVPFEQAFFDLYGGAAPERFAGSPFAKAYQEAPELLAALQAAPVLDPKKNQHPYFQNPRPETLLIDEIEALWKPINENDDWQAFHKKIERIRAFRGLFNS